MNHQQILQEIIFPSLKTASSSMPGLKNVQASPGLCLYGNEGAILDSLNLVSFIFILEEQIKAVDGRDIKISARDLFSQEGNPFSSLTALATLIEKKLAVGETVS